MRSHTSEKLILAILILLVIPDHSSGMVCSSKYEPTTGDYPEYARASAFPLPVGVTLLMSQHLISD